MKIPYIAQMFFGHCYVFMCFFQRKPVSTTEAGLADQKYLFRRRRITAKKHQLFEQLPGKCFNSIKKNVIFSILQKMTSRPKRNHSRLTPLKFDEPQAMSVRNYQGFQVKKDPSKSGTPNPGCSLFVLWISMGGIPFSWYLDIYIYI